MSVILVTSAIKPRTSTFVQVQNPLRRLIAMKAAIYRWIDKYDIKKLVIVDGSGCKVFDEVELHPLNEYGIEVEQICYMQSADLVEKHGKGYGEGEAVDFAVCESKLINNAGAFYKITGKLFVDNYSDIDSMIKKNGVESIFYNVYYNNLFYKRIDTRFWFSSRELYEKNLKGLYKDVSEPDGRPIEQIYYEKLDCVFNKSTASRPVIHGLSGGLGLFSEDVFEVSAPSQSPCYVYPNVG